MKNPKFVLKKTKNKQYHFTLQAKNGETVVQSETYTSKSSAKKGIYSIATTIIYFSLLQGEKNEARIEKELNEPLSGDFVEQFIEDSTNED